MLLDDRSETPITRQILGESASQHIVSHTVDVATCDLASVADKLRLLPIQDLPPNTVRIRYNATCAVMQTIK
jgi:hypothetical protein